MLILAPIERLKKSESIWLKRHYCKHRHTYLEHYECFKKENPLNEKIGFFDIETSNLAGDFGVIFCYCIKPLGKSKILERVITRKELSECLDREVVRQCVEDIQKFDRIVGFYSKRFDMPFIRTRASYHKIDFPLYGSISHDDIYFTVRHKFRLSSNRLENACRTILGESSKTHLHPVKWIKALQGDPSSLKYILNHCREDVRDLERLWERVINFSRKQDTSI